jgi:enamine deaminase RidA (YjgF/YER057c/UK114 family)
VSDPLARLAELGLRLPPVATPAGAYVPALRHGGLIYTSGQLPFVDGVLPYTGLVGLDVTVEQAYECARLCALNALAAVASIIPLAQLTRIVKVTGFVASAPGFGKQPAVINGASELLGELFGESGRHARSAVGVAALPAGTPVEVELVAAVD